MPTKIQDDLKAIAGLDPSLWEGLRNKRIFGTGCTGFIGAWFIHSFSYINKVHGLNSHLTLLTRDKDKLVQKYPVVKDDKHISILEGDIQDFDFPEGKCDFVIHGATEVASFQSGQNPSQLLDVSYLGTKRLIQFCKSSQAQKVLFLSSGAAYGPMPDHIKILEEGYTGAPLTTSEKSSYGEAKRLGEQLLFNESAFKTTSARIFAACGPYLPMGSEFAFSNFLRDCIQEKEIEIKGNGKTTRSYLYASDLILWLWVLLLKGRSSEIYNVGSQEEVSILELAQRMIGALKVKNSVKVLGTETGYSRYIPSNEKIMKEFRLPKPLSLEEAILKSFNFYEGQI